MDIVIRKSLEKDLYSRYKNGAEFAKDLTAVRYKIVDENERTPDHSKFSAVRKLTFFTEFDDIEIWEVVRFAVWRKAEPLAQLMKEGGNDQRFGILLEGEVELSIAGRVVSKLQLGDSFGETAYLDEVEHTQHATVVSLTPVRYLEVSPAVLSLASEECLEHFRQRLISTVARRLAKSEAIIASSGVAAIRPTDITSVSFGTGLTLLDN